MTRYGGVELDDVQLSGDRLVLRPWGPDDAGRPAATGGTALARAVVERHSGRVVGSVLLGLDGPPLVEFAIVPDARGSGYAGEAVRMVAAWGFGAGLPRIGLECEVSALAAVRTAMAAGFRFEGVARGLAAAPAGSASPTGDVARFGRLAGDPGLPFAPVVALLPPDGLSDGVMRLRPVQPHDARALVEMEDEVSVHWGFFGHRPDPEAEALRAAQSGLDWLVSGPARMAIVDQDTGAVAGTLTLRLAGPPHVAELGYVVHPSFRGRRLTTRALRLFVPWAFDVAGFARLELGAKVDNLASQRSALAAGFEPDGVCAGRLRNPDGTFADEARFALVNPRS